jgi:hypothetical protein
MRTREPGINRELNLRTRADRAEPRVVKCAFC